MTTLKASPTAITTSTKPMISRAERRLFGLDLVVQRSGPVGADASQNCDGRRGPRASPSASKYSRAVKLNIPAITTAGKVWILVL